VSWCRRCRRSHARPAAPASARLPHRRIPLADPFRFRFATGGQISNYHWPSDRADALDYVSVARAGTILESVIRSLDRDHRGS
jgi:hypothetical protein